MSLARSALAAFLEFVSDALTPEIVALDDGPPLPGTAVKIRPVALERTGRSQREYPVLDLELSVAVMCSGEQRLDNAEQLLKAMELTGGYRFAPLDGAFAVAEGDGIGYLVRMPVAVPLEVPVAPLVLELPHIHVAGAHRLHGMVIDADGRGIAGARIRSHTSTHSATSDSAGRFNLLGTHEVAQRFTVEFDGAERDMSVSAEDLPITLHWQ